jgi:hypothetical protein
LEETHFVTSYPGVSNPVSASSRESRLRTSGSFAEKITVLMMMSLQSLTNAIVLLFACCITAVCSFQSQPWPFPERIPTVLQERKRTVKSAGGGFGNAVKDLMSSTFPYSGPLRPGNKSPQRVVLDENIVKPDYWQTGTPKKGTTPRLLPWMIEVKTAEEIVKMRAAGKLARQVLDLAGRAVRPGITTDEIDTIVYNEIVQVCSILIVCREHSPETHFHGILLSTLFVYATIL